MVPMYLLCRVQELLSFAVRRIAAFDLVQPSYALAAFAVRYGSVLLPKNISASARQGGGVLLRSRELYKEQ